MDQPGQAEGAGRVRRGARLTQQGFRPVDRLGQALSWAFLAWPVVCAFEAVRLALGDHEYERAIGVVPQSGLVSIGQALTAIPFLLWFERVHANVVVLSGDRTERGSVWAVVSWLVPFANFVVPYRAFREILQRTAPARFELLGWYWACWLAVEIYIGPESGPIATTIAIGQLGLLAAAALLVRVLVLDVSRSQHRLAAARA